MNRAHLILLAAALTLVAVASFAYKLIVLRLPLWSGQRTEVWRLETELRFKAEGGPAKLTLQLPGPTGQLQVLDQSFVSPGYGLTVTPGELNQQAVFSIASAKGEQVIYSRLAVTRVGTRDTSSREPTPELARPTFDPPRRQAAEQILASAQRKAADAETLAGLVAQRLRSAQPGDEASYLLGPSPSLARVVGAAVDILSLADVPARSVHGVSLELERRQAEFVHWLEVLQRGRWRPVYVGETRPQVVRNYLAWWRGAAPLAALEGGSELRHHITVSRSAELALTTAMRNPRAVERQLLEFSLFGLPLQTQFLFRSLLVIPVGILLLVLLRNIVGMKTFGTFMPVLIALAFRETGLAWGMVFFAIIVAIGLSVRFYLDRLRLLLVPRLAVGVIVVVLIIAGLTVLFHRLGFQRGLSLGLFPIVILTMTIERMCVVWEEQGAREALQQAAGSLAVGALSFLVMNLPQVEHVFFVFPELLLIILAATLLLGRYSGYRLSELWRFRALVR